MTEKKKTPIQDITRLINSGMSQAEVARTLGISRQAVYQRLKGLKTKTTKAVVDNHVEEVVQDRLDTMAQLKKSNQFANELLDTCMAWTRGDEVAIQVLETQMRQIRVGAGTDKNGKKKFEFVKEYKFKDPRDIALKAMAEIRHQLKLQFDIFSTIYSMKTARDFQDAVLEVIRDTDPHVADRIVRRLHSKQAVRRIIELPRQGN